MNQNFIGSISPEKGFFRQADTGAGGGGGGNGGKDDENNDKKKDQEPLDIVSQLRENLKNIASFIRNNDPVAAGKLVINSRELIRNYQPSSEEERRNLLFFTDRLEMKAKALYLDLDDLDNDENKKQKSKEYPDKQTSDDEKTKKTEDNENKDEKGLEKQERHEVLLERLEKQFTGIKKYLKVSKDLGVDLTKNESRDLALDLEVVFGEFIDPDVKTKIRNEISREINSKSKRLKQDGVSDGEKSILRDEIKQLYDTLQNPFTYISESGFTDEQFKLIKQEYEKYCNEIKQLEGKNNPNEEQQINRAKIILGSDEFLDFMKKLRKLALDSKSMSSEELQNKYADLMAGWSELGIRSRIFYNIVDLSYQASDGQ
jgi:hypothetical protein